MTDFVTRDISSLWDEILQRHWTYLETEEGLQKLDERKKLEGCLKEFLCIVPHDRKFFLPETSHVLKKSIKDCQDFSAYKAMIGFESISQYANNLFTKPWRKEYRVIKMYSGFYQHEIKSNLIDAEKLFEAMGYRQLSNQLLVLDGPICPDQVTNVSRDAMAAYVECQIMKQILNGLSQMQIAVSWSDLFNFRENHICGISQGVKSMAYIIQERRFRKEKLLQENCYSIPQSTPPHLLHPATNCMACYNSMHACHPTSAMPSTSSCQIHGNGSQNGAVHNRQSSNQSLLQQQQCIPPGQNHYNHHYHPQIPHSKSLEHYNENQPHLMPIQRHSFDHYDNYHQNCQFSLYNHHPYNVSGNRYPLPYPLSNQLNTLYGNYGQNNYTNSTNCVAHKLDSHYQHGSKIDVVLQQPSSSNCIVHSRNGSRTQILQNDHLIDFNEHTPKDFSTDLAALVLNDHHKQYSNRAVGTDDLDGVNIHSHSKSDKKIIETKKLYDNNLSNQSSTESTRSSNKNHDGVGSFETWDFVFQNLEKHNYTKDLGGRGDLLVQGLNLDSSEKRNSKKVIDEKLLQSPNPQGVQKQPAHNNKISEARIVRQTDRQSSKNSVVSTEKTTTNGTSSVAKITKTSRSTLKNSSNNNDYIEKKKSSRHNGDNGNNSNKILTEKPNVKNSEWSCRFCTFLNPETKRICEMCCRSKDFSLEVKTSPTCV